jgi:sugar-specific transcriptional regulator TrmB
VRCGLLLPRKIDITYTIDEMSGNNKPTTKKIKCTPIEPCSKLRTSVLRPVETVQKVVQIVGHHDTIPLMDQVPIVQRYLHKLGLEPESTRLYVELITSGHSSALQLAKTTNISRTQVYRLLESLQEVGLVSAEQLNYGTLYRALPLENIEGVLANREAETAAIRRNLGAMSAALQALAGGSSDPKATVQHFYGQAGLKQANWNLTKADKEYRVFEVAHLSQHMDQAFARRCREQCIARGLHSYDLTNATKVTLKEVEPINPTLSEFRHIDPTILTINFEVYIYNDIVTLIDYRRGHEMAMEIHHPSLKSMMQQLFDTMWASAATLEIAKR